MDGLPTPPGTRLYTLTVAAIAAPVAKQIRIHEKHAPILVNGNEATKTSMINGTDETVNHRALRRPERIFSSRTSCWDKPCRSPSDI